MSARRPPRIHALLLRLLVRGPDAEFLIGDIGEDYSRLLEREGRATADAWYRRQVRASIAAWLKRDRGAVAEAWRRDLHRAARSLARSPGFTTTTVLTLGVGLGGAAALGALARWVVRPLPYPDAHQLVAVWEQRDGERTSVAPANYLDWRRSAQSFQGLAAADARSASVTVHGAAERARVAVVSGNLFQVLGVEPVVGRTFDPTLDPRFPGLEAVIGHDVWHSVFGGAPDVAGRSFKVDEDTYRIVGVAPPGLEYPEPDLFAWVRSRSEAPEIAGFPSLERLPEMRDAWYFEVLGRLRPLTGLVAAREEMTSIAAELERLHPESNEGRGALLVPMAEEAVAGLGGIFLALATSVALVLLAAGVNVAQLVWARSGARLKETAVREALGAARGDLARPFVAEGAIVGLAGAATGLVVAAATLRAGAGWLPASLPRGGAVALDWPTSAVILFLGACGGMYVGGLGFLRGGHAKGATRRLRQHLGDSRSPRPAVVVAQVAAAIALLGGAALMGRSVLNLASVHPGFAEGHLVTMRVALPDARSRPYAERVSVYRQLADELGELPGVTAVGFASTGPLSMGPQANVRTVGQGDGDAPNSGWQPVDTGFFRALGVRTIQGRTFHEGDGPDAMDVGVVNEAFVRQVFRGGDALGRQVTIGLDGHDRPITIVGVLADTRTRGPARPAGPVLYRPARQTVRHSATEMFFAVRGPSTVVTPSLVRAATKRFSPGLPVYAVSRGTDLTRPFRRTESALLGVLGVFAALSLLLGIVGVYGVTAHSVQGRRREIGVRLALGADSARITREVVAGGLRHALVGVPIGIALTLLLGRALAGMLFDVLAFDASAIAASCILVLAVTTCALYLPARAAARTDPAAATRGD